MSYPGQQNAALVGGEHSVFAGPQFPDPHDVQLWIGVLPVSAVADVCILVDVITGDAQQVAGDVAEELNIDEVFAGVLPADKDNKVAELQARELKVAVVGDGVNDSL